MCQQTEIPLKNKNPIKCPLLQTHRDSPSPKAGVGNQRLAPQGNSGLLPALQMKIYWNMVTTTC